MSKAKLSKKRVVLRRAAKRRARYEGTEATLVSAEPPAYLRWALSAEDRASVGEPEEEDLVKA